MSKRPPVIIHLHVPKCYGSSINNVLLRRFRTRIIDTAIYTHKGMSREYCDEHLDCVSGHVVWGVHRRFNRPFIYISATRDPIERICSHFNFVHRRPQHPQHESLGKHLLDINDLTEETFDFVPGIKKIIRNLACRVYRGDKRTNNRNYEVLEKKVVRAMENNKFIAGDLTTIISFLQDEAILEPNEPLPHLNQLEVHQHVRDFAMAKPADLTGEARRILLGLTELDRRLIDTIHETNARL